MVYHPGLVRESLAFHGCAELFQVRIASLVLTLIIFSIVSNIRVITSIIYFFENF